MTLRFIYRCKFIFSFAKIAIKSPSNFSYRTHYSLLSQFWLLPIIITVWITTKFAQKGKVNTSSFSDMLSITSDLDICPPFDNKTTLFSCFATALHMGMAKSQNFDKRVTNLTSIFFALFCPFTLALQYRIQKLLKLFEGILVYCHSNIILQWNFYFSGCLEAILHRPDYASKAMIFILRLLTSIEVWD